MTHRVLEVCSFTTVPGTDTARFLALSETATAFLHTQPGFVDRRLAQGEDGSWIDVVEWTDMASAKKAGEAFLQHPDVQPFCALIDMATCKMAHHTIIAA